MLSWQEDLSNETWDDLISYFGGHPLQTAHWGEARKASNHIQYYRWAAFIDNKPVFLARFEVRTFFKFIKIAWLPKGPLILDNSFRSFLLNAFLHRLKKLGYIFCFMNPWEKLITTTTEGKSFLTIWLDLTVGKEKLWNNLQKQFRYGARRAVKLGVCVERSRSAEDIYAFNQLCTSLSIKKHFQLCTSPILMSILASSNSASVESYLFAAKFKGKLCGGAFIIRCGNSIHYMWGGIDRSFSHLCVGEAIQWAVVDWGVEQGCKRYDLEGITESQNSGVDIFKKKLGGEIIATSGIQIHALYWPKKLLFKCSSLIVDGLPQLKKYKKLFLFR